MVRTKFTVLAGALAMCLCAPSHADLLGLDLETSPDITSLFISTSYNATTDAFSANGFAMELDTGGSTEAISSGSFSLNATIDDTGTASAGSITIGGNVLGNGPTLLTGNLLDFGFGTIVPGTGPFEFIFEVTGGDLAGMYGGIGASFGVVMSQALGFSGDWGVSFNGSGMTVSDAAPLVPAPAVATLLLGGLFAARRRRRA